MQPYVGEAKKLKNFLTTLEIFKNILVRWWGGGHTCVPFPAHAFI